MSKPSPHPDYIPPPPQGRADAFSRYRDALRQPHQLSRRAAMLVDWLVWRRDAWFTPRIIQRLSELPGMHLAIGVHTVLGELVAKGWLLPPQRIVGPRGGQPSPRYRLREEGPGMTEAAMRAEAAAQIMASLDRLDASLARAGDRIGL